MHQTLSVITLESSKSRVRSPPGPLVLMAPLSCRQQVPQCRAERRDADRDRHAPSNFERIPTEYCAYLHCRTVCLIMIIPSINHKSPVHMTVAIYMDTHPIIMIMQL